MALASPLPSKCSPASSNPTWGGLRCAADSSLLAMRPELYLSLYGLQHQHQQARHVSVLMIGITCVWDGQHFALDACHSAGHIMLRLELHFTELVRQGKGFFRSL